MNELAAKNRAEELAEAIGRNVPRLPRCYDELTEVLGISEASVQYECDLAKLIEQALLAERKSVWEEAAKIVVEDAPAASRSYRIRDLLRAAAEKEVGK